METPEIVADRTANLYEIGYLLNPLIPAEEVAGKTDQALRVPIEKLGGEVAGQLLPTLKPLAYPVTKAIGSKRDSYKDAYFGALRFDLTADKIITLKEAIDKSELILRYILIRLPKNAERSISYTYRKTAPRREINVERTVAKEEPAVKVELSEEQIDKEIEDLLVETK